MNIVLWWQCWRCGWLFYDYNDKNVFVYSTCAESDVQQMPFDGSDAPISQEMQKICLNNFSSLKKKVNLISSKQSSNNSSGSCPCGAVRQAVSSGCWSLKKNAKFIFFSNIKQTIGNFFCMKSSQLLSFNYICLYDPSKVLNVTCLTARRDVYSVLSTM